MRWAAAVPGSRGGWDRRRSVGQGSTVPGSRSMISTTSSAMLPGVWEREPSRSWFGKGGCVERHDDGTNAVFLRGELLGIYATDDVATRDLLMSVVIEHGTREDLARAFSVSVATVGRVVTRFNE